MVLMMRLNVGGKQIKRFLLMVVNIPNHGIGERIHAIAGQLHRLFVVIVKRCLVSIGGKFQCVGC